MSKDNDWILNAQRAAARKMDEERQLAQNAELAVQRAASEKQKNENDRSALSRELLVKFTNGLQEYIEFLRQHGYEASLVLDQGFFSFPEGSFDIKEYFSSEDVEEAALEQKKAVPSPNTYNTLPKQLRLFRPYVELNEQYVEVGDSSYRVWESPRALITVRKSPQSAVFESTLTVASVTDVEYQVGYITEASKIGGKNSTRESVDTKEISRQVSPPCVLVKSKVNKPASERDRYWKAEPMDTFVAYSPEGLSVSFRALLSEGVTKLEELFLKEPKPAPPVPVEKKKRWGLF